MVGVFGTSAGPCFKVTHAHGRLLSTSADFPGFTHSSGHDLTDDHVSKSQLTHVKINMIITSSLSNLWQCWEF